MAELKKVLCPVDLTPEAGSAAEEAATLAQALGAELLLLHVMSEPAYALGDPLLAPGEASAFTLPALAEEYRAEMDKRLKRLGEKLRARSLSVSTLLVRGAPHEAIVGAADDEHADLIVMSTHGRSGLSRWFYGSVAEQVLRHCTRPLLVRRVHKGSEGRWTRSRTRAERAPARRARSP